MESLHIVKAGIHLVAFTSAGDEVVQAVWQQLGCSISCSVDALLVGDVELKESESGLGELGCKRLQFLGPTRAELFPAALPEFFLKLLTEDGDLVLDPFAGSNTTGAVAESLGLRWIAVELVESYLEASRFRFFS